ncbi:hypothetical protein LguiA_036025 [Lonicera macranthoides]
MSVIKSGGNQGKAKRLCPFTSFKERILKAADSSENVLCNKKAILKLLKK